jgi:hypothetical protein
LAEENSPKDWSLFKSGAGFTVKYPSSWFRKGIDSSELMILSSRGGAEAIIITRGQAMIFVKEEQQYLDSPLSQVEDHYVQDGRVISRKNIHNGGAETRMASHLTEIVVIEPVVPPEDVPIPVSNVIYTMFFCEIDGHKYVTVSKNFEGDKRQTAYQQTALRVAESIRRVE